MERNRPLTIVYFGAPGFAAPALAALAADPRFAVRLVVSQPDRPSGRGRTEQATAVSVAANVLGLPLYQPPSLRTAEARRPLVEADADLFVVAAFGLIFGKNTLSLPKFGCLNLHASLLPAYRGASPIQAAILNGDAVSGVTLMQMDIGLDTGDMIAHESTPLHPDDTTESLTRRLAESAATLATRAIPAFVAGAIGATPQPEYGVSVTRPLTKDDGQLDWRRPAVELERQVRAMWPWPRAWTTFGAQRVQVLSARPDVDNAGADPGTTRLVEGALRVACGQGSLLLDEVLPAGGKQMTGAAFMRGSRGDAVKLGLPAEGDPREPIVRMLAPPSVGE